MRILNVVIYALGVSTLVSILCVVSFIAVSVAGAARRWWRAPRCAICRAREPVLTPTARQGALCARCLRMFKHWTSGVGVSDG